MRNTKESLTPLRTPIQLYAQAPIIVRPALSRRGGRGCGMK